MSALFVLMLIVCSIALPSASAEEPFRDNIQDIHDALIGELVSSYHQSNGQIQLPNVGKAKEGTLGDLRLLNKPSDGLTLPCRADFVTENPRMAMFRFGLKAAHAVYKNYKPFLLTFKKRTLNFDIEELDFFVDYTITVENNQCRLNFLKVRAKGKPGQVSVTGGLLVSSESVSESFTENLHAQVIEAARKDVESRMRDMIENRYFVCSFYEPSKQFLTA